MENDKTLERRALLSQLTNAVHRRGRQFLASGVATAAVDATGILFPCRDRHPSNTHLSWWLFGPDSIVSTPDWRSSLKSEAYGNCPNQSEATFTRDQSV